jgi:Zn-dependent oligopeptidase
MVANLAKPTPGVPALMTHDDVVTFFHEMGHAFHSLLSRTRYLRFHGTQVARDFIEAPSQMLENWCWEPMVLAKISSHYITQEPLSKELIERIVRSRYVNIGTFHLRQIFLAKFDLLIHSAHTPLAKTTLTTLWNELRTKTTSMKSKNDTLGHGAFGHLMGGYDAGYYGYAYSVVFAADMYKTVFESAPLDPEKGRHYRETILFPGGSRDEMDSLKVWLKLCFRCVIELTLILGIPWAPSEHPSVR